MGVIKRVPVISTTALTCATTKGSATVTSSAQFASVLPGMRIVGAGIPFDSVVDEVASTSSLTIKNEKTNIAAPATATSASVSLRFGYFTSLQYASGDTFGFPFDVPMNVIWNVLAIDTAKQLTKLNLYFFSRPFTEVADNAAFAPSAADAKNLIGYISLATSVTALTNAYLVTQATTALPICIGGGDQIWCQAAVLTDTPTMTAVDNVTLLFTGE